MSLWLVLARGSSPCQICSGKSGELVMARHHPYAPSGAVFTLENSRLSIRDKQAAAGSQCLSVASAGWAQLWTHPALGCSCADWWSL